VQLKWPNDAYLRGTKLSGCLCESEVLPHSDMAKIFIGIGVNVSESHGFTCLEEHTRG